MRLKNAAAGLLAKAPTVEATVSVFKCGNCKDQFPERAQADACCVCKCGRPCDPPVRGSYGASTECEVCLSRSRLVHAKGRLRKMREELAVQEEHVAKVQAQFDSKKAGRS